MLKIIGTNNCAKCIMTKQLLEKKNTEYEYVLLEDLSKEEQGEYLSMARKKGMMTMPLILKNEELITLQEV